MKDTKNIGVPGSLEDAEDAADRRAPGALARLVHHRWALPALAQVAAEGGCKFITLQKRLGVAPQRLKVTLQRLESMELVVPNPSYGHPMRPEYVLGDLGTEVSEPAQRLISWMRRADVERPLLKKWSLPALSAMGLGARRFSEISSLLTRATSRATTLALKDLVAVELAERRVGEGFPPTTHYTPLRQARLALRHAHAIGKPLVLAGWV
ncbi:MAG: winged helix-turn-helix transcriptional regulator [Myxococcota bacterium]